MPAASIPQRAVATLWCDGRTRRPLGRNPSQKEAHGWRGGVFDAQSFVTIVVLDGKNVFGNKLFRLSRRYDFIGHSAGLYSNKYYYDELPTPKTVLSTAPTIAVAIPLRTVLEPLEEVLPHPLQ